MNDFTEYVFINAQGKCFYEMVSAGSSDAMKFRSLHKAVRFMPLWRFELIANEPESLALPMTTDLDELQTN